MFDMHLSAADMLGRQAITAAVLSIGNHFLAQLARNVGHGSALILSEYWASAAQAQESKGTRFAQCRASVFTAQVIYRPLLLPIQHPLVLK